MTHIMVLNEWMTNERRWSERDKSIGFCFGFGFPFSFNQHMCFRVCVQCASSSRARANRWQNQILQKDWKLSLVRTLCSVGTIRFAHFCSRCVLTACFLNRVLCKSAKHTNIPCGFHSAFCRIFSDAFGNLWLGQEYLKCAF